MKPIKSYRVWMSQRNGSTVLCKALEQTGIAGKPNELFNIYEPDTLCSVYKANSYVTLRKKLWELGSTPNGVFGIKHSNITDRMDRIFAELCHLRGMDPLTIENTNMIWDDLFPNCKHIFLTRRNKVRQAVSWWKAINDNQWHIESGKSHTPEDKFYEDKYDYDALFHLLKETVLRECSVQQWFSERNIQPLTFVYEDFIQDFDGTVQRAIDFLEIEYDEIDFAKPYYRKIADSYS
ncbi:MAG: sulfotransferase, partial [Bacteroidia bacterium]|nr:sulfotransferase [Bacteroidia bacterium]